VAKFLDRTSGGSSFCDPIIAKKVVELLNLDGPTGGPDYYRVVPDNYKLRVFEP
jgi:hypothetical protein